MRLHKNNNGITLVELIISMAITAIVLSMLALIISTASKSFKRTNEDVNLQMEAQTAINQLTTILMEASSVVPGSAAPEDKKFLINNSDGSNEYAIYLIKDKHRLYLISADDMAPGIDVNDVNPAANEDTEYQYLLAEYVDDISIDTGTKSPEIVINFSLGDETYTANKKVTLRNAK